MLYDSYYLFDKENIRFDLRLNFPAINFQSWHMGNLEKHEVGFVLILKSAWGVLSTLYFWAWGVLSAFKKICGGFCPPITKWTWGVMSVGCFVSIPLRLPPQGGSKEYPHP